MIRVYLAFISSVALVACGSDFEAKDNGPGTDAGATGGSSSGGTSGNGGTSGSGGTSGNGGSSGGGGTTGGTGGTGAAPAGCPSTHSCVSPAPTGWNGPFALTSDPTCPSDWTDEKLVVHDGLTGASAECDCTCTAATSCPSTLAWLGVNNASCPSTAPGGSGTAMSPGNCQVANALPVHGVQLGAATPVCTPKVQPNIPPATWSLNDRLCDGAKPGGKCDDPQDTCLPSAGVALCVEALGETDCPEAYPAKHVYYTGLDDTRKCPDSCPCSTSGNFACTANLHSFSSTNCTTGGTSQSVGSGEWLCVGGSPSAKLDSIAVASVGTCTPGTASPSGEVAPKDPHTVCCVQ